MNKNGVVDLIQFACRQFDIGTHDRLTQASTQRVLQCRVQQAQLDGPAFDILHRDLISQNLSQMIHDHFRIPIVQP